MAQEAGVIEIVTMNLAEGVTAQEFAPVDKAIEDEHVSQQPGFISRQAAFSDGKWVVVVNWDSAEAAQASMNSFASAPAAAPSRRKTGNPRAGAPGSMPVTPPVSS